MCGTPSDTDTTGCHNRFLPCCDDENNHQILPSSFLFIKEKKIKHISVTITCDKEFWNTFLKFSSIRDGQKVYKTSTFKWFTKSLTWLIHCNCTIHKLFFYIVPITMHFCIPCLSCSFSYCSTAVSTSTSVWNLWPCRWCFSTKNTHEKTSGGPQT